MIGFLRAVLVRFAVKGIVIKAVQYESSRLRDEVKAEVAAKGVGALDSILDATAKRINVGIEARAPKWAWLAQYKAKLEEAVSKYEIEIKSELDAEVLKDGPAAIDTVFKDATDALVARIDGLPL